MTKISLTDLHPTSKKKPQQEKIAGLAKAIVQLRELSHNPNVKNPRDSGIDAIIHYLHSIISNISQGLIFIDIHGVVITYNEAAKAILEVDALDVLYTSFWTYFSDDLFGFSMRKALSMQKSPGTTFATITTSNGKKLELEVHAKFIQKKADSNPSGEPLTELTQGMIVLLRDITTLRSLQEKANRNDRLKALGEMAARVAHEIRNPLGGIKGYASLLRRDLEGQEELQKMADSIIEGTNSLNMLVTNILNYSHPIHPSFVCLDLIGLVREVHQHVQADETIDPKIVIDVEFPVTSLIAPVDPQLLKSALLNLVVNAVQSLPAEGGKVLIFAGKEDDKALIKISDTGVGIPEENLEKVFSPFFTTKSEGTGLGLPEVYKVIQAHEGHIEVESRVGKGTTFTIALPLNAG